MRILLTLLALLIAAPAFGQNTNTLPPLCTTATLLTTCVPQRQGMRARVKDATDATVCTGAGSTEVTCVFDGTTWFPEDEVGIKTSTSICQGDGTSVQCDIATELDIESALGENFVTVSADDISSTELMTILSNEGDGTTTLHGDGTWSTVQDDEIADGAVDGGAGGEIADGTIDGEDMNANYAGAYLEETADSPDTIGVTAPLTRDVACVYIEDPAVEDMGEMWQAPAAITIDRVWCMVEAATDASINIENGDGSPVDILSSDLVCDVGEETSCASGCDVDTIAAAQDNVAQFDEILVDISAITDSPGVVKICWHFTIDDV